MQAEAARRMHALHGGGGLQVRDDVFDEFRVDELIGKKTNKAEKPKELTRLFSNVYTTQDSDSIDSKCAPPSSHRRAGRLERLCK